MSKLPDTKDEAAIAAKIKSMICDWNEPTKLSQSMDTTCEMLANFLCKAVDSSVPPPSNLKTTRSQRDYSNGWLAAVKTSRRNLYYYLAKGFYSESEYWHSHAESGQTYYGRSSRKP